MLDKSLKNISSDIIHRQVKIREIIMNKDFHTPKFVKISEIRGRFKIFHCLLDKSLKNLSSDIIHRQVKIREIIKNKDFHTLPNS